MRTARSYGIICVIVECSAYHTEKATRANAPKSAKPDELLTRRSKAATAATATPPNLRRLILEENTGKREDSRDHFVCASSQLPKPHIYLPWRTRYENIPSTHVSVSGLGSIHELNWNWIERFWIGIELELKAWTDRNWSIQSIHFQFNASFYKVKHFLYTILWKL